MEYLDYCQAIFILTKDQNTDWVYGKDPHFGHFTRMSGPVEGDDFPLYGVDDLLRLLPKAWGEYAEYSLNLGFFAGKWWASYDNEHGGSHIAFSSDSEFKPHLALCRLLYWTLTQPKPKKIEVKYVTD